VPYTYRGFPIACFLIYSVPLLKVQLQWSKCWIFSKGNCPYITIQIDCPTKETLGGGFHCYVTTHSTKKYLAKTQIICFYTSYEVYEKLVIKNPGLLGCDTALLDHKPFKLWQNIPLKQWAPMTQRCYITSHKTGILKFNYMNKKLKFHDSYTYELTMVLNRPEWLCKVLIHKLCTSL
jgi:hypothetical protein